MKKLLLALPVIILCGCAISKKTPKTNVQIVKEVDAEKCKKVAELNASGGNLTPNQARNTAYKLLDKEAAKYDVNTVVIEEEINSYPKFSLRGTGYSCE